MFLKNLRRGAGYLKIFSIVFLFIVGLPMAILFFHPFGLLSGHNLFGGSPDSARYLLSALAQSRAAILAIVVTLTLIAVQSASQTYSPRVIDLFLRNRAFWILVGVYAISIIYDITLLNMVTDKNIEDFTFFINSAIVLMAIALLILPWYTKSTLEKLKPQNIIDGLAINAKEKIVAFVSEPKEDGKSVLPNSLPIIDVIRNTITLGDSTTARYGIKTLGNLYIQAISKMESENKKQKSDGIIDNFNPTLQNVGKIAIYKGDDGSAAEVIKALRDIGIASTEGKMTEATYEAVSNLGDIGIAAAERGLGRATNETIWALRDIGCRSARKELERKVILRDNKMEPTWEWVFIPYLKALSALEKIGIISVEKGLTHSIRNVTQALGELGTEVIGLNRMEDAELIAENVFKIYNTAKKCRLDREVELGVQMYEKELDFKEEKEKLEDFNKFINLCNKYEAKQS